MGNVVMIMRSKTLSVDLNLQDPSRLAFVLALVASGRVGETG